MNTAFHQTTSRYSESGIIRKHCLHNVTVAAENDNDRDDDNELTLFLEEYIHGDRDSQSILRINNLIDLMKARPDDYVRLLAQSIPHTKETIESDLTVFYQNILKVEDWIESLPTYDDPRQKLAGLLVELSLWHPNFVDATRVLLQRRSPLHDISPTISDILGGTSGITIWTRILR